MIGTTGHVVGRRSGVLAQTAIVTIMSVLSPAVGLLAEMALAWRFGAGPIVDAYRVTILMLLYGQQLFVTYILPSVLVPAFAECRAQGDERKAWILAHSVGRVLLLAGLLIAAVLFIRPDLAVNLMAPGLSNTGRDTAVLFMRWCGLAYIPLCWTGAACGILYAHEIFQIAPLAQLISNLVLVLAIVLGGRLGAGSLIVGVLGGSVASTTIYTVRIYLLKRSLNLRREFIGFDLPSLRLAWRAAAPMLGSVLFGQATSVIITRALSTLPAGTLAAFGYAWRMCGLAQIAPNSLSTVLFPKFSEAWYLKGPQAFSEGFTRSVRGIIYIAFPLTAICWMLRTPLVTLFFRRGAFTTADVNEASMLFGLLILGSPALCVSVSLARAFYAIRMIKQPILVDVSGCFFILLAIPLLVARFGAGGACTGYTLLYWLSSVALFLIFDAQLARINFRGLTAFVWRTAFSSAITAWIGAQAAFLCARFLPPNLLSAAIEVVIAATVTSALYYFSTIALGLSEAHICGRFVKNLGSVIRVRASRQTQGAELLP